MTPDAAGEFASWARLRLFEDDCAVLRKFRGDSTIRTYLTTVLVHLFLDWRNAQWGRWRPTAVARRLGPLAIELEQLVLRDGRDYEEAVETLVSRHAASSRAQCDETWSKLRRRPIRRMTSTEVLVEVPAPGEPHTGADFGDPILRAQRVGRAVREALRRLDDQEQIIIRLNYVNNFTAKQIAEATGLVAKPLYRRIEQIVAKLGQHLQAAGLTKAETLDLFSNPAVDLGEILDQELRKPGSGPSTPMNAGGNA